MTTGLIASGSVTTNNPSPIFRYTPNSTAKLIINQAGTNIALYTFGIASITTSNTSLSSTVYLGAGQQFVFQFAGTGGGFVVSALEESS